jgi:hypothetical protein
MSYNGGTVKRCAEKVPESRQPTDDRIVDEVMTNWRESKERIGRSRWLKALDWMRQQHIITPTRTANPGQRRVRVCSFSAGK